MPDDEIDELFQDLRDYPGKREPMLRQPAPPRGRSGPQELNEWDDHPRILKLNGQDTEFFTIRHVALALGRSARTIRTWEAKEIIPPATFRTAKPHKSKIKDVGDRLWTRAQVEAMVTIARDEGVLKGLVPSRMFTLRLIQAFLALQEPTNRNTPNL